MKEIVDCHCHIYPDKITDKASSGIGKFYNIPVLYDGRAETVRRLDAYAGITRSVIFSVATKPAQVRSINEFIAMEVMNGGGLFVGLGTAHPESDDIKGDIKHLVELGLRGVKLHHDIQGYKLDDYRCLKIYEICEDMGLPVLIHAGDSRFDCSNPNRIRPVLETFPGLKLIGAHLGGYTVWDEAVSMLCGFPNFYVDSSSSLYAMTPERGREIILSYGTDRVLFGADFPLWNPAEELRKLYALGLDENELENILWKNANRLFKLGLGE